MNQRLKTLLVMVIIGVTGVAVFLYQFGKFNGPWSSNNSDGLPIILEPLEAIPPADPVPGLEPIFVEINNLTISVIPEFELYMLHSGNVYHVRIRINITNNGPTDITNFNASKVSVYNETSHLHYTFGLLTQDNTTIPAGATRIIYFTEDRRMPVVYSMWSLVMQYARVLVLLGSTEAILTSNLSQVLIAIE